MTGPAVSIVVPCYNGGRFLDTLMASIEAQTFRDFEVVIVNDGSTEELTIRKLASLRSVARVVDQENKHLPAARNTGFRAARGEYVLPLDCDDCIEPSYLEEAVAAMRGAPADVGFVFTHMRLTGALEGVLPISFNRFRQLFLNRLPYCMMIRKSAWAAAGGYDEEMRDGMEDWEFNIRLAEAGYRGLGIPKPLFVYLVRQDGMLWSKSARLQGTIWRYIRARHADAYRPASLLSIWREPGNGSSSLLLPAALFSMAKVLPESWFNAVFFRLITLSRALRATRRQIRFVRSTPAQ